MDNNNNNDRCLKYDTDEFLKLLWGEEKFNKMKAEAAKRAAKAIEADKKKNAKLYMEMFGCSDLQALIEEDRKKEAAKEVAEEPVRKIRVATPEDIEAMAHNEPATIGRKKPTLATAEDLAKKEEDEAAILAEIAAYDAQEEEWLRLELEDHDRMCEELDMLEKMTEEEKKAYYEKKFAEEDAKWDAEIAAQKKEAEERGYSYVSKLKDGQRVWEYQLEADNKTRFNLREMSIKYRKEKGLETAEDRMDRIDRDYAHMNKQLDEFEKELKKVIATDVKEGAALTRKKPKLISNTAKEEAVEVAREAAAVKEPLKVKTMVNRFKAKDKAAANKWIGAIKNNQSENFKTDIVDVTLAELGNEILKGKAIVPAVLDGKLQDVNFVEQQLFALDIDYIGVSLQDLKDKFKDYPYALIYTSFSHTAAVPKYRLLFVANRVIKDADEARFITAALMDVAGCADERCSDVSRIFYAGRSIVEIQEKQFSVDKLLANTSVKKDEVISKATAATGEKVVIEAKEEPGEEEVTITVDEVKQNLSTITQFQGMVLDYDGSFNWINSNVNLGIALGKQLNVMFRCLKPGHIDRDPSAIVYSQDNKYYYKCWGDKEFEKPKSVIDTLSMLLNMDKIEVQYLIVDALGITMGSAYQKNCRLLIADTKANITNLIKPDTILYKEMKYLWGALSVIQDFASAKVTISPLSINSTRPTFYMSRSQLRNEMLRLGVKGAGDTKKKLDQLKDLGFIRPLSDEEIVEDALRATEEHRENMILSMGKKCINRVEYYELCAITSKMIADAEEKIATRKRLGAKKMNMGINRRLNTYGLKHTATVNIQGKVEEKAANKISKRTSKVLETAEKLKNEYGYFTEDMLRQAFDPKGKRKKADNIRLIDDTIPLIIQELNLKKDRVKNQTRTLYSIPSRIKTNTTIYTI